MKPSWLQFVRLDRLVFFLAVISGAITVGQSTLPSEVLPADALESPAAVLETPAKSPEKIQLNSIDSIESLAVSPTLMLGRNSLKIQQALQPLVHRFASSVVQVEGDDGDDGASILGTIVSADGLIVTKHSELAQPRYCVLKHGKKYAAVLIGIHPQNDLALLKIEANDLVPVPFRLADFNRSPSGQVVISIGAENESVGVGMVTTVPQTFAIEQPECADCVDLGVTVSKRPETRQIMDGGQRVQMQGMRVQRVYPRTASESAGLLVGDLIRTINGNELSSRDQLTEIGDGIKVGQRLTIGVIRDQELVELSVQIKSFSQRTLHDRWGGGPYSTRRFGFGTVIAHDSVVRPEACGGPLVTLDGRVLGINVARSMRTATFAIPMNDIYYFVKYVRPNAILKIDP